MTSLPAVTTSEQPPVSTRFRAVARQQLSQNVYYSGRTAFGCDDRGCWASGSNPHQHRDRYSRRAYC